jgi:hypothetical protein
MEPKDVDRKLNKLVDDLHTRIKKLEESLEFANNEIDRLNSEIMNLHIASSQPRPLEKKTWPPWKAYTGEVAVCPQCGLQLKSNQAIGYVCPQHLCPMGLGSPGMAHATAQMGKI